MKRSLERYMGSGPEQGAAARFILRTHGDLEVVVVAGDRDALQLYIQELGLDPLLPEQMVDVMLVEQRHVQNLEMVEATVTTAPTIPGNGTTH